MRRRKGGWRRPLLLLAGAVLGILAAEGGARVAWPQFSLGALAQEHGGLKGEHGRLYRPSILLGWERIPTPDRPLDEHGFLSLHDARRPKEPGEVRVAMVGDSVGELGIGLKELALLEEKLSAGRGKKVKIWLLATGAHNLAQYAKIVRHRADKVKADAVIILFCINDMSDWGIPVVWQEGGEFYFIRGSEDDGERIPVTQRALFLRSHLYRSLRILKTYGAPKGPGPDRSWPNEEKNDGHFRDMKEACARRGVPLAAALFPYFKKPGDYSPLERAQVDAVRRLCERHGLPLFDLLREMPGDLSRYQNNGDYVHPSRAGYDECLRRIAGCYSDPDRCLGEGAFQL